MEIMNIIDHFHFLRPWWLLMIPLWILISYRVWQHRQQHNGWSKLCDPALLNYLLDDAGQQKSTSKTWLTAISMAGIISSIAMAGPVWKQLPQPVIQATSAMILVLDLSRSMDAEDIKSSRLIRAKQKIQDILAARTEGQTGLIVFAGSAFDVVPLTTDNQAILSLLSALDTSMMPAQGSLASLALQRALAMFQRGAIQAGSIVMLCDGVDQAAQAVARQIAKAGHVVNILAVGTTDGAPIPINQGGSNQDGTSPTTAAQNSGGFMKDASGNIILARLNEPRLAALAAAGHGLFQYIRFDDADVMRLPGLIPSHFVQATTTEQQATNAVQSDQWYEEGPWLVLLILPLVALAFRRGLLLLLLLVPLFTAVTPTEAQAITWDHLWQSPDQQAQTLMAQGKFKQAAKQFNDPAWKAAALYRAGQFDAAAQALENSKGADNQYNKANALAHAGKLKSALKAYDQALKDMPHDASATHDDAQFNRDLVEKALKKQQQKNNQNDQKNKNDQSNKKKQNNSKKEQKANKGNKTSNDKKSSASDKTNKSVDQNNKSPQSENDKRKKKAAAKPTPDRRKDDARKAETQKTDATKEQPAKQQDQEQRRALEQMLRRIPDDPGGLLRRKFKYQYQNQQHQSGSQQAW